MPASTSRRGRCWWPWARPPSRIRACRSGSRVSCRVAELVVAFDVASAREALGLADRLPGLAGAELGILREALGPDPWLVVPGIRLAGEPAGDQVRTVTPEEAVRRGATHLVVGRSITAAPDPAAAFQRLLEVV